MYRNIRLLSFVNFFMELRFYAPVAILYFADVTDSFALGMSIFSIAQVSSAIFEIPTGIFSDSIGRRNTLIVGAASSILSVFFYALGGTYWILIIGAVFEGLSRSFFSGNNEALLHDTLSQVDRREEYATYLGKTSSFFSVAAGVSSLIGGFLAFISYSLVMWISVIPQIALFITAFFLIEPKIQGRKSGNIYSHLKESFILFIRNTHLRNFSIANFFSFGLGETGYQFQSAFYATVWPIWAIGIAKSLSNIFSGVSYYFSGWIMKRFRPLQIFTSSILYSRFIVIISVLIPSSFSPLIMSTTSVFHGITEVARSSLLHKEFTDKQRATMGSITSLGSTVTFAIIAFIIGWVADIINPAIALFLIQVCFLPVLLLYVLVFRHKV